MAGVISSRIKWRSACARIQITKHTHTKLEPPLFVPAAVDGAPVRRARNHVALVKNGPRAAGGIGAIICGLLHHANKHSQDLFSQTSNAVDPFLFYHFTDESGWESCQCVYTESTLVVTLREVMQTQLIYREKLQGKI